MSVDDDRPKALPDPHENTVPPWDGTATTWVGPHTTLFISRASSFSIIKVKLYKPYEYPPIHQVASAD